MKVFEVGRFFLLLVLTLTLFLVRYDLLKKSTLVRLELVNYMIVLCRFR
jgi:hypothetical protein